MTETLEEELACMRQEGLSVAAIGKLLGRSPNNVEYLLGKFRILKNKRHDVRAGQTYGCWLVTSQAEYVKVGKSGSNFRKWNVQCTNCGKTRQVYTSVLSHDAEKYDCGYCKGLPKGQSGLKNLYQRYKTHAAVRRKRFTLTIDEFQLITTSNCIYCDCVPSQRITSDGIGRYRRMKSQWSEYVYNGVDRCDNAIGYLVGNCVPCCKRCNRMKSTMTLSQWFVHMERLSSNKQRILENVAAFTEKFVKQKTMITA